MNTSMKGVWRDEEFLVVSKEGAAFPDVCIFTNKPVSSQRSSMRVVAKKYSGWETNAVTGIKQVGSCSLKLPLAPEFKGIQRQAKRRIGRVLVRWSVAFLIVGIGLLAALIHQEVPAEGGWVFAIFGSIGVLGLGIVGLIIGLAWPYLDDVPGPGGSISAELVTENHVWLKEAHPDYLRTLQPWEGPSMAQEIASQKTLWQALAAGWPALVAFIILTIAVAVIKALIKYSH